jgi:hypothetical protein
MRIPYLSSRANLFNREWTRSGQSGQSRLGGLSGRFGDPIQSTRSTSSTGSSVLIVGLDRGHPRRGQLLMTELAPQKLDRQGSISRGADSVRIVFDDRFSEARRFT